MAPTSDELAAERTDLALERTRLAHERTLMAWVRTATGLISFGFTLFKFFEYFGEQTGRPIRPGLVGPRGYALAMMVIGLVSLVIAIIEHQRGRRTLTRGSEPLPTSLALIVAGLVAGLGVLGISLLFLSRQ